MEIIHQHHGAPASLSPSEATGTVKKTDRKSLFRLAMSATVHCLVGCGIGEVTGMVIGAQFGLDNLTTIVLSILLAFIGGILIGLIPMIRFGFTFMNALKTVIVGEGLSIAVMTAVEVAVEASIPGVMSAHLTDWLFWAGMGAGLTAGFIAAFPVNYFMIRRGISQPHSH